MERTILFDYTPDIVRAAVLEDGELCEIHSERVGSSKLTESLFYGRIEQIRPSVSAAFVNVGLELNAFLPLDELERACEKKPRCGDMIIVQGAAKQETDTKGLRVTARINLAGKWLVLVPGETGVHVSKKVRQPEQRAALLEAAQQVCPQNCGLIVRTASQDVTLDLLREEAESLYGQWQEASQKAAGMTRPGVLRERISLEERLIRDLAGHKLTGIVTNDAVSAQRFSAMQRRGLIDAQTRIEWCDERNQLIFDAFCVEGKIDRALRKRVWLPCGGYLIIDRCEAMTVIDVNSGKMMLGCDIEETALRVNLEAAKEIAHQIRLRDVGGIIVVDFIDMRAPASRDALTNSLKEAIQRDRAQVTVHGLTKLGLMEMTRKRVGSELHKQLRVGCSYCSGNSEVLAPEETARRALTQIRRMALSGQRGPFAVKAAPAVAEALSQMTAVNGMKIYAVAVSGKHAEKFEIEQTGAEENPPKGAVLLNKRMEL